MDYSVRLDHLHLQSLERRRLIADLVLTYKIIFGLVDLNKSDCFHCNLLMATALQNVATRINSLSTIVVLMRENISLVSELSNCGTVSHRALLVSSNYRYLEDL